MLPLWPGCQRSRFSVFVVINSILLHLNLPENFAREARERFLLTIG
jgi:hypothetical protein